VISEQHRVDADTQDSLGKVSLLKGLVGPLNGMDAYIANREPRWQKVGGRD
jgi:hypothetical protein